MRTFGKLMLAFGACALMAAPAWAQGQGRGGFGMMGGGTGLLTNKSVQKELKVTDEQAPKLEALATELREKGRGRFTGLQDLPQDERRTKMQELQRTAQAELHKGIDGVLNADQVKRFKQIEVQVGGLMAFSQPRVQEALKLTDDQKTKVREIGEETRGAMPSREDFTSDREAAMKKMAEIQKGAKEKATALLTDDQKKSWKELTGDSFDYVPEAPRPRNN